MVGNIRCKHCGTAIDETANFCNHCGKPVSGRITCPSCHQEVKSGKFCGKCGVEMSRPVNSSSSDWHRDDDTFAVKVPETKVKDAETGFEVRHGTKALFFENGRLVDKADSRRYTKGDSFLRALFAKKRKLSALLVDAGDVVLPFTMSEIYTADKITVDVQLDVVLRLDDHNAFYLNVMKDRSAFTTRELRSMLFAEVQNSVIEALANFSQAQLTPSRTAKEEIASRLENHLRTTFGRMGLDFGHVRAIAFNQEVLDKTARGISQAETEARDVEAKSKSNVRVGMAKQEAHADERALTKKDIEAGHEDLDVVEEGHVLGTRGKRIAGTHALEEKGIQQELEKEGVQNDNAHDLDMLDEQQGHAGTWLKKTNDFELRKQVESNQYNLSRQQQDADYITKRLAVYEQIKKADISKIKTDEDFRKFQVEVDRDKVLDKAEWQEVEDELLWKKEDRRRDRSFLVDKIDIEQRYDLEKLEIINKNDKTVQEKKEEFRQAAMKREEEKRKLEHIIEMISRRQEVRENIKIQGVQHEAAVAEIEGLEAKNLEVQLRLKELEVQKTEFERTLQQNSQEISQEKDKAQARHDIKRLDVELTRLKSELGMNNLEKLKAIKRQDKVKCELHELEMEEKRHAMKLEAEERRGDLRMKEQTKQSENKQNEMLTASEVETSRLEKMGTLNIEQLIAVSGMDQAKVLGELGQTREMKGKSAEEIMAMNDPAALGRALEERAKGVTSDELKGLYERILHEKESSGQQLTQAYKEVAERAERMADKGADRMERVFSQSTNAMQGMQGTIVANERHTASERAASERMAADRTERMAHDSLYQMGGVATTRSRPGESGTAAGGDAATEQTARVVICANCKQEIASTENFCPNCGNKMY